MEIGNRIHDDLMSKHRQQMFTVNSVIQYVPSLKLKIKEEQNGINSVTSLKSVISILPSTSTKKLAFVIVLPLGNSIVLHLYTDGTAVIMDSHNHQQNGALITIFERLLWKTELAKYLCRKLCGSDVTQGTDIVEVEFVP